MGIPQISAQLTLFGIQHELEGGLIKPKEKHTITDHLATLYRNPLFRYLPSRHYVEMLIDLSDVTLNVGDKKIPAHRFVLCCRSRYFHAMLSGRMKEASQEVINLEEEGGEDLVSSVLIKYLYSSEADESHAENNILQCAIIAHKYGGMNLVLLFYLLDLYSH